MIIESTTEKTLFEVSEIQLGYKSKVKPSLRRKIESSKYAERVLWHFYSYQGTIMKGDKHINDFKGQISKTLSTMRKKVKAKEFTKQILDPNQCR